MLSSFRDVFIVTNCQHMDAVFQIHGETVRVSLSVTSRAVELFFLIHMNKLSHQHLILSYLNSENVYFYE